MTHAHGTGREVGGFMQRVKIAYLCMSGLACVKAFRLGWSQVGYFSLIYGLRNSHPTLYPWSPIPAFKANFQLEWLVMPD